MTKLGSSPVTVAFDLDGVLADFVSAFRPVLGVHSTAIPSRWNWSDVEASKDDVIAAWNRVQEMRDFYRNIPTLPGVSHLLAALIRGEFHKRRLLFITSRPPTKGLSVEGQAKIWLSRRLGLLDPEVFACENSFHKLVVLREQKVSFYLDDFAPLVEIGRHVCKGIYLLRQPWNQSDELAYSIPAVWSVREFLEKVNCHTTSKEGQGK